MKFKQRHKLVARNIHQYFLENAPGIKYLAWDKLNEEQRLWWLKCSVAAIRISEQEAEARKKNLEVKAKEAA